MCNNHIFTLLRYILLHSGRNEYVHSSIPHCRPLSRSRCRVPTTNSCQRRATLVVLLLFFILTYRILRIIFSVVASSAKSSTVRLRCRAGASASAAHICAPHIFHCLRIFVEINKRANDGNGRNEKKKVSACSSSVRHRGRIGWPPTEQRMPS